MTTTLRIVCGLAIGLIGVSRSFAQEGPEKPKLQVELRWVEAERTAGLTEEEGFQTSCDPDSVMYPHKKPALVLTAAEVAEASLKTYDFSKSGSSSANHMVTIHLTPEAREKLAAACEGDETRVLTVVVDGKYWGVHRYEKDKEKKFVPDQARAESFVVSVGFFSSRYQAQRLVNALQ